VTRPAAVLAWISGLGFGLPAVFGLRYFTQHHQIWTFLGFPNYGGPFERWGIPTSIPLLAGFIAPGPSSGGPEADRLRPGWLERVFGCQSGCQRCDSKEPHGPTDRIPRNHREFDSTPGGIRTPNLLIRSQYRRGP